MSGRNWTTADPLGLGSLLLSGIRLMQIAPSDSSRDMALINDILQSASAGIQMWINSGTLSQPALRRLAFRELGLAIGIKGLEWIRDKGPTQDKGGGPLEALSQYFPLAEKIIGFWADPDNQQNPTWTEHIDINEVMLATALRPQGYIRLPAIQA